MLFIHFPFVRGLHLAVQRTGPRGGPRIINDVNEETEAALTVTALTSAKQAQFQQLPLPFPAWIILEKKNRRKMKIRAKFPIARVTTLNLMDRPKRRNLTKKQPILSGSHYARRRR